MVLRAPALSLYKYILKNKTDRCRRLFYQILVLAITFLTYTSYHLAKRPFSVVKGKLGPNCNVTQYNNTCFPWKPFDNPAKNNDLFGLLDFAFLTSYAIAMFFSGYIAEHTNLRLYLSGGMVITGILTSAFGLAYYLDIHTLYFYFALQILTGIFQSTGWPCVVESVGNWFPEGRRGLVMGIWNTHVSLGNILGSLIAGAFVDSQWGLSFIVPGGIIAIFGVVVYFFLVPCPSHVHLNSNSKNNLINPHVKSNGSGYEAIGDSGNFSENASIEEEEAQAVGIWKALKIPGVIEYSLCLFFAKLVSYTFLFWLPYYIGKITIEGQHFDTQKAADWSVFFDVGGMVGGIVAGALTDYTQRPGIINVVFLICAAPALFVLRFYGQHSVNLFIFFMVLSGFFVNGPYALITTAVSASLGTHKCLQGNTKATAVVTSIIDATGSLGAAVGPLLAGLISDNGSWSDVFYMLIAADLLAGMLLFRQFINEIRVSCILMKRKILKKKEGLLNSQAYDKSEKSETDSLLYDCA